MPNRQVEVKKHRLVRSVLQSEDFTVEHPFRASRLTLGPTILDTDGPKHSRAKRILGTLFSMVNISSYRENCINPIVQTAWSQLRGRRAEIVREFAVPVPTRVIFAVLGLPQDLAVNIYEEDIK